MIPVTSLLLIAALNVNKDQNGHVSSFRLLITMGVQVSKPVGAMLLCCKYKLFFLKTDKLCNWYLLLIVLNITVI